MSEDSRKIGQAWRRMNKLNVLAVAYLFLPLLIFSAGWLTPVVSIPLLAVTCYALYRAITSMNSVGRSQTSFSWPELTAVFVLLLAGCVVCGQGGIFFQDVDWPKHNAILRDLTERPWPVVYDGDALLTYYIGNYIIPALIGKFFSSVSVSFLILPFWNAFGFLLVYCLTADYLRADTWWKKALLIFFLFFWGGAPNLGSRIYQAFGHDVLLNSYKWIDFEHVNVHFSPNFDAIRGTFQHVIAPWICTALFLQHRDRTDLYVLFALPLLFTATFGFLFFAIILFCMLVVQIARQRSVRQVFSAPNLLLLPMAGTLLLYLAGNFLADKPDLFGFAFLNMFLELDFYLAFTVSEFLMYAIFLFHRHRRDVLFYIVVAELLLIPFVSLGHFNDLCSRGSIPARFLLMVWCLQELYDGRMKNLAAWGIAAFLLVAVRNEGRELQFVIQKSAEVGFRQEICMQDEYGSLNGFAGNGDIWPDNAYNYYTMHYHDSLFYMISRHSEK